jgi:hypothetical protein
MRKIYIYTSSYTILRRNRMRNLHAWDVITWDVSLIPWKTGMLDACHSLPSKLKLRISRRMLTDITLEVDLAAVCTRKFSSFSMEFDDSTVSCHIIYTLVPEVYFYYFHCEGERKNILNLWNQGISYTVLYMNLHESKHNSQRAKLQQMSIYYRHCHCATQYSMFRQYFDSQSQRQTYLWRV